jgi:hypothetical protein
MTQNPMIWHQRTCVNAILNSDQPAQTVKRWGGLSVHRGTKRVSTLFSVLKRDETNSPPRFTLLSSLRVSVAKVSQTRSAGTVISSVDSSGDIGGKDRQ